MMKAAALQSAVYARLNDASVTSLLSTAYGVSAIFTDVPQADDSGAAGQFPYITIGNDTIAPYDTKDDTGGNAVAQVSIWSRVASDLQIKGIADAVYARMHRQAMTISGVTHITTEFESMTMIDDPDGKTRQAVMLFRVIYLT
jgi:hypothetical protein